jgi:hypothetical protein
MGQLRAVCTQSTQNHTPKSHPYGYGWVGCSAKERPRPKEWDVDYGGKAASPCYEVAGAKGVFRREYPKAVVEWDCHSGRGSIKMK